MTEGWALLRLQRLPGSWPKADRESAGYRVAFRGVTRGGGACLCLQRLAEELAKNREGGRDLVVEGREAACLEAADARADGRQVPHHHEAEHQAHAHLCSSVQGLGSRVCQAGPQRKKQYL